MAKNLNYVTLGEHVSSFNKGITPNYSKDATNTIVLNQKCIRGGRIDYSLSQYVSDEQKFSSQKKVEVGDILINSTGQGTAGRSAYVDSIPSQTVVVDSHMLIVRLKDKKWAKMLAYCLYREEDLMLTLLTGSSGQGELSSDIVFNNLFFPFSVNFNLQFATQLLNTIDKKISLNNEMNGELDRIARLTYDYWFMQFDYPNDQGKPYKSTGGELVYSDQLKRDIPVGWKVVSLRDLMSVSKNGDWGQSEDSDGRIKAYCIRGADINGLNGLESFEPPTRYIEATHSSRLLKENDLIVEISGGSPVQSTGRMAHISGDVISRLQNSVVCSNFCKAISLKDTSQSYIVSHYWNRLYESGVFFNFEGKTSGIKNLMFDQLVEDVKIALPHDHKLVHAYYDFAAEIDSQKQINLVQNQELTHLRDWLLPMLMTGQVKMMDTALSASAVLAPQHTPELSAQEKKVQRKMLACYIANQSLDGKNFGKTKFEKLLHLIEYHILKKDLGQKYSVQPAGPYDGGFTILFWKDVVEKSKWYKFEGYGNLQKVFPGQSHTKSLKDYGYLSDDEKIKINRLLDIFKDWDYKAAEVISTLYAVWNNRLIKGEDVTDDLLKQDFLQWDSQKSQYINRLDKALAWMRENDIIPDGWGKEIKKKQ